MPHSGFYFKIKIKKGEIKIKANEGPVFHLLVDMLIKLLIQSHGLAGSYLVFGGKLVTFQTPAASTFRLDAIYSFTFQIIHPP